MPKRAPTRPIAVLALAVLLAAPMALPARPAHAAADLTAAQAASLPDLVARLMPSVVNISTRTLVLPNTSGLNAASRGPDAPPSGPGEATTHTSVGSGFVIDADGVIVTNNHVIEGAYDITVTFNDGQIGHADVLGTTKIGDIALLQVHMGRKLPALKFGDSTTLRVGQPIVAIGNPLGFSSTVSTGIISALNRDIMISPFDDFIQTDAALNHGNSGGPMFNMDGQVIGVNTALYTPSPNGGSIGIGFAIPAYCAQFVIGQLRQFGHVKAGELGMTVQDVTADIANATGLPPDMALGEALSGATVYGSIVTAVAADGPAAQVGIQEGDIVRKVDNVAIQDIRALARIVAIQPLGQPITVSVWRGGKMMTLHPIVREWASGEQIDKAALARTRVQRAASMDLGLKLGVLDDKARADRDLASNQPGVLVASVEAASIAGDRGLGAGDVVLKVQNEPVSSPDALTAHLQRMWTDKRPSVLLLVRGQSGLRWVALPLYQAQDKNDAPVPAPSGTGTGVVPITQKG